MLNDSNVSKCCCNGKNCSKDTCCKNKEHKVEENSDQYLEYLQQYSCGIEDKYTEKLIDIVL